MLRGYTTKKAVNSALYVGKFCGKDTLCILYTKNACSKGGVFVVPGNNARGGVANHLDARGH